MLEVHASFGKVHFPKVHVFDGLVVYNVYLIGASLCKKWDVVLSRTLAFWLRMGALSIRYGVYVCGHFDISCIGIFVTCVHDVVR